MKENLENSIKQGLENFEPSYNPAAWDAMASKLDVVKPVTTTPKAGYKWLYISGAVAVSAVAVYLMTVGNSSTQENIAVNNVENQIAEDNVQSVIDSQVKQESHNTIENTTTNVSDNNSSYTEANNNSIDVIGNNSNVADNNTENNNNNSNSNTNKDVNTENTNDNERKNPEDYVDQLFKVPSIENLCQSDRISVVNENKVAMSIIYPSGKEWNVNANSQAYLVASEEGLYRVGYYKDGKFYNESDFKTLANPKANYSQIDTDIKYDEFGLPSTTFEALNGSADEYVWKFDNQVTLGQTAVAHFYTSGNHNVELTVKGINGCTSTKSSTVYIEDNYNLKAVTSFVPTDLDPRNNQFMPASLKERGDVFVMQIIDPNDGHIIYESKDASLGWNGIDSESGKMVPYQKAYIWKVVIANPNPGENGVYAGTVIPLESRR